MSDNYHYYIVELYLPVITSACTINGNAGYGTPLTCTDETGITVTQIRRYEFTDTNLVLAGDIYKNVKSVNETTPKLKAGNGVASRATASITFSDFIGDPNEDSPAVVANPNIINRGTFFGKLKERQILANKKVVVKYYRRRDDNDTLVSSHQYIATEFKQSSNGDWVLVCKDALYKADDTKSQFPKVVTGNLNSAVTASSTTLNISGNIADWTSYNDYVAVIGDDICLITNATGTSTNVMLTVTRQSTITLGARTITNEPKEHSLGDEVFRGRKYENADLYNVLQDIFLDSGISTVEYDGTGMQTELDSWLASLDNSIDCIFYEPQDATSVLNEICQTFLLDIWTDTSTGKIKLKANSPWQSTVATLTDGIEIIYDTVQVSEPDSLQYSRSFLQFDKRQLTASDDDVNFKRSSVAINRDLEGEFFYDEEKIKVLPKSIILSNKTNNLETADLTTTRFVQRFSNRPQVFKFEVEEDNLDFELADVVGIVTPENQGPDGSPKQDIRAQVVRISPKNKTGRLYQIEAITYNPFAGGISGSDITVYSQFDINLFTEAGGPTSADTFNFLFDGTYGQQNNDFSVKIGSFPSGSVVNIVCLNGATITARGGNGGDGGAGEPYQSIFPATAGLSGGNTLEGTSGVTVNVWLNGSTGDLGNGLGILKRVRAACDGAHIVPFGCQI